jgi:hypothetical protein
MCFNCKKVAGAFQVKKSEADEQNINCINVWRKCLLIIQIKKDSFFMDIKKLKKLSFLSKGYHFYEGDRSLKENQMLKKGIHFIHYRCMLKGGGK